MTYSKSKFSADRYTLYVCIIPLFLFMCYFPVVSQNISDFRVNEYTGIDGSKQETPDLDGDGQGNYVITWMDDRSGADDKIFAQIFLNDSTPLSNNFIVNDDVGTAPQYGPNVAVDPNLNFVITWLDRRNGYVWDIYAQRYSGDGTPLGANFKVNEEPENEEQVGVTVSIDSSGNFLIVWADEKSGDWDIYGQRYMANGTAVGDNFKINDDIGDDSQYWPTCELAKNGDFIVAWSDQRYNANYNTYHIYAQRYLSDGTPLGNNFKVNTDDEPIFHYHSEITIMENGNFMIAWCDERDGDWDVYAQRYMSDGTTNGGNFKLNDDFPDSDQRSPSVSADMDGNFTVCWVDGRNDEYDIYGQRFTYDATSIGNNFQINIDTVNSYHNYPLISVCENGNFMVAWEDNRFGYNGDIFAQYYLNDGTATGDNFRVNDNINDADQTSPSITKSIDDNFIIGWAENQSYSFDLYVRRFSGDGLALGNRILVNDAEQNYANYGGPSISADDAGNFVVAWDDYRYEYWGEIYAQRFSSDGTALDSNFKVNTLGYNPIYGAMVACKKNGDFIIVWGDSEDGGKYPQQFPYIDEYENLSDKIGTDNKNSQPDIWAQMYLSDGTPLGTNFKVNDDDNDTEQTYPVIALDSLGNFIIAWYDNRNGDWEIFAQRYLSDGTAVDSNIKIVENINVTYPRWPSLTSDNDGNFIITWIDYQNDNNDIWGQQFSYNCLPTGDIFLVNDDNGSTYQSSPCVSSDKDGKFIITWTDWRNGTRDVYAQRYLSDGQPLGSNYQVSNTDDLSQQNASVILDNNRIFSTWQDNRGGQSGHDIWANVYDWDSWVGIEEKLPVEARSEQCLGQNYPNPFNSYTRISYVLNEPGFVTLDVYDLKGRKIKSLINEYQYTNAYSVTMDGNDLNSGIYFYKLNVGDDFSDVKKMILMR